MDMRMESMGKSIIVDGSCRRTDGLRRLDGGGGEGEGDGDGGAYRY